MGQFSEGKSRSKGWTDGRCEKPISHLAKVVGQISAMSNFTRIVWVIYTFLRTYISKTKVCSKMLALFSRRDMLLLVPWSVYT